MDKRLMYLAVLVSSVFVFAGCGQKEKTQEAYEDYLKITWVVEDWHGEKYYYHAPFYFVITKINGENMEGNYSELFGFPMYWTYTGVIEGESARCALYDSDNKLKETETLELTFLDSRRIEGKFMEDEKVQWKYVFRPYNLNDIDRLRITKRFQEEVDTWGEISVAVGTTANQVTDKPYISFPVIYIVNESDDILYEFQADYQVTSEFYEMDVADYNGDGLDDIKIVTYFPIEPDHDLMEHIFYQTEEHLFKQ